jgi:cytochrome c-type biogenesis protein CcmF
MNTASFDAGIPAFGTAVLYAFLLTAAISFAISVMAGTAPTSVAPRFLRAARLSALGTCALIGLDVLLLLYGFLSHDFRIRYVAHYSDRSMPTQYLIAALWGGQDGSLLWWTFLLSLYTSACVLWLRGRYRELAPWIIATLMSIVMFFGVLMIFAANPFAATFGGAPADGDGLNPQLQNFYMAIHPPSLYTGFVGCAVPFAFAMAALITGRLGEEWVIAARRWVLFAWMFLSIGNVLGMLWAAASSKCGTSLSFLAVFS